ncbi:CoA pyrophosphatase [Mycolicibacterium sp. 018/SC-01/001]|uniref:NUDIX hydrolase n=1 Tax=Mycolicibacterium sp. 018/SC-01/001 TaxID=2592069 RepID=UPI00117D58C2|nr:CoA pyrophosphatase [Mycolicibacterium sp. 018/SC-01/001]TRW80086.1 CoA pyrophosphatase [Mycolicibacterium sp. 018/SC-01/001]
MSWEIRDGELTPDAAPPWLTPIVTEPAAVKDAFRQRVTPEMFAALTAANVTAAVSGVRRDAAVLVLFSGPEDGAPGELPADADLLVTMRASTLRHHAGQAAFPGGAADPGDHSPVHTALREATEETGLQPTRLRPLATLDTMFIPPSGFQVVPVLAFSTDPGPVSVVDESETAVVARVPVRAFVNPANRLMVYRKESTRRFAGPAFLLNEMLVWGFTGQIIAAIIDVAGWTQPWDTDAVYEVGDAMARLEAAGSYGEVQR